MDDLRNHRASANDREGVGVGALRGGVTSKPGPYPQPTLEQLRSRAFLEHATVDQLVKRALYGDDDSPKPIPFSQDVETRKEVQRGDKILRTL